MTRVSGWLEGVEAKVVDMENELELEVHEGEVLTLIMAWSTRHPALNGY